jgi:hypothetical protein
MKSNTLKTVQKPANEILNFSTTQDAPENEIDARCYWILSLVGGLLLSGIWLGSLFLK